VDKLNIEFEFKTGKIFEFKFIKINSNLKMNFEFKLRCLNLNSKI